MLLTQLTGERFPQLTASRVLGPIGMSRSRYEQPLLAASDSTAAHAYKGDGSPVPGGYYTYPEMAAAGLWSTAPDLARFGIELQKDREGKSQKLLNQASVQEMLTMQMKPRGLGFELKEGKQSLWFMHNGVDEGFQASMMLSTDGDGIAIMTNSDKRLLLAREIVQAFAHAYGKTDFPPQVKKAITLTPAQLSKYAGVYRTEHAGDIQLTVEGDHLMVESMLRMVGAIYPESRTRFFRWRWGFP